MKSNQFSRTTIRKEGKKGKRIHNNPIRNDKRDGTNQITILQHKIGNRALQRLIAQGSTKSPAELDNEIVNRIDHERGGGQLLDPATQEQAGPALRADFSDVRVHNSPEADLLNQQLNARAFTTGQDIFFRAGEYQPGSSSGQELIAHELAHVVQQSSGVVSSSGSRMTVNPPGDRFEQAADAVARQVVFGGAKTGVQHQVPEEEENEVRAKTLQRQAASEEEEEKMAQKQEMEEEEEGKA